MLVVGLFSLYYPNNLPLGGKKALHLFSILEDLSKLHVTLVLIIMANSYLI
jgi:hypothetical protein